MYKQRSYPVQPSQLHHKKGAVRFQHRQQKLIGEVLLGEPPSAHEQTQDEELGSLQLRGFEGSQSSGRGIWQGHHWAQAIILVFAYNTSQQVNPVRVFIFYGGIGLPQHLIVIIVIVIAIRGVVLLIVIIIVIVVMVHVNISITRKSTRRAWSTRGSGCRTTASQQTTAMPTYVHLHVTTVVTVTSAPTRMAS
jgi:hypothetical protein